MGLRVNVIRVVRDRPWVFPPHVKPLDRRELDTLQMRAETGGMITAKEALRLLWMLKAQAKLVHLLEGEFYEQEDYDDDVAAECERIRNLLGEVRWSP